MHFICYRAAAEVTLTGDRHVIPTYNVLSDLLVIAAHKKFHRLVKSAVDGRIS